MDATAGVPAAVRRSAFLSRGMGADDEVFAEGSMVVWAWRVFAGRLNDGRCRRGSSVKWRR